MADDHQKPRRGAGARRPTRRQRIEDSGIDPADIAAYFKERVYATFTGLAIVLVAATSEHPEADHAFFALILGVIGITAAGFVSEIISHLSVHQEFPDRAGFVLALRIAGGAMGTVLVPGVILVLAWIDVFPLDGALIACVVVFIMTLAVIGWFAVRRSRLPWWQQLLALVILLALGLLVIGLQTIAHSV
ncbi:hypothetical protein ACFXP7_05520 [Microbacterium sp. P06]|uniref:hypothetical protein n=1 Tax=Microbacterium sp. P06 TaxID=3366949 RepID=UPI00374628F7